MHEPKARNGKSRRNLEASGHLVSPLCAAVRPIFSLLFSLVLIAKRKEKRKRCPKGAQREGENKMPKDRFILSFFPFIIRERSEGKKGK